MTNIVSIHRGADRQGGATTPGLENREAHYRLFFETARDAILTICAGEVVDSNPAALRLFECSASELAGPFPERFSPRYQPDGRLSAEAARKRIALALGGSSQLFPWRHQRRDGQPVETEVSLNRVDSNDTPMLQAVIRDVTHRTHSEESIRAGEMRFRGLFDAMVEGVAIHQMVYGPDGHAEDYIIEEVNPAFERIIGLSKEKVVGGRSTAVFGTDTPPYLEIYSQVAETGRATTFESHFVPMGRHFSISVFAHGPGRFATVFSDITDAKQAAAELARNKVYLEILLGKRDLQLAETGEQLKNEIDQRLAAEASLKESEQRYRSVFEHAGSGMVILESDMTISLANAVVERITGYSRLEIEGKMKGLDFLVPEDARQIQAQRLQRLRGEAVPDEYECRLQTKAGEIRHILLKIGVMAGTDKAVGSLMDITQRKAAEAAMTQSEGNYRSLFENAGAPTMILEADMTIAMINPRFEKFFGFPKNEVEGRMSWTRMVHPDDVERMKTYHRERRRPGGKAPREYDCRFVDRSGGVRHIHLKVGMLPDGCRSIGSLIDLTDHVQAEEALRRSQAQLTDIIDATEGYIYTVNADFRIGFMNKALMDSIGRDATGEHCYRALHERDKPCSECVNERVLQGETVKQENQRSADGRWLHSIHSPLFDARGVVTGKQVLALDITERKLAEEAIQEKEAGLQKENQRLRTNMKDRYRFGNLIGKSPAMQKVYDLILKAAGTGANTIVYGESGTGKELAARAIHDMGDRRDKAFVPVNCGAIPEHLLESEFFGYKKGAFTGATSDKRGFLDIADGGTLFLDEVGEIGLGMQVKLLRAIEGGGFIPVGGRGPRTPDVRIIAATNRNLAERVATGAMREDFYYRIHVIPIDLPPLRERKEDLPLLVEHFLKTLGNGETVPPVTGRMLEKFSHYHWPGNVRELQNVLSRYITLKQVDFQCPPATPVATVAAKPVLDTAFEPGSKDLKQAVEAFEKAVILRTLDAECWQKARAATLLGIHRKTLFTKMRQYNLAEN
ncbi:MAG: PAS domain S-box protein [Desulfobacterales bacterium]|nr:PAS domain S-box protein [Desulfobacterales bacterium]